MNFVFDLDTRAVESANPHNHNAHASRQLAVLRTCKQIHAEAHLLALSLTPFHVSGDCSYPDLFDLRSRPLSPTKLAAIRHLTLTARISHLRALNEAWAGLPFGHPCLSLDTLTIVPRRPDCSMTAYAEVADLSQCHTLAYIFAETLKGLRNVKCVEVRNEGCFNAAVWRIVYRSLVYRLWKWGGDVCGARFEASGAGAGGEGKDGWFKVYLQQGQVWYDPVQGDGDAPGREVGQEVMRLAGGVMPDPDAGAGP
ncbi:hypothetical protein B0A50_02803 [Salinomyces thailandicus]|uniref:Uncharacterized protein n=1 Tax=Salinomyces thailandicus TaxID=706561 RepID=A0A4U0U591_9PEZI|nr:hypothetical protein B0A50_02803 [Salinomyces thailandica]